MARSGNKKHSAKNVKYLTLALLGVGLVGCSSVSNDTTLQCPEVSIISDGAELIRFASGQPAVAQNIIHQESFEGFAGSCEHNIDDAIMSVEIIPKIFSAKGPANMDGTARFDYFVALSDSQGAIINKQRFPVNLTYLDDSSEILWQEDVPVTLTLPLKDGESVTKYRIFIGLQLSRDELKYIKANR
ncbi:MAG: hypothetical protein OEW37_02535 [Rhodospirillaceae bacterium]|nr:hypothetical protein [Rhodospirillaceae bacterium]